MTTENTQTQIVTPKAPLPMGARGVELESFEALWRFAQCVAASPFAPKGMEKAEAIVPAIQLGLELGLSPMAALQNVAVINGRPGIYGDAALALVRASGKCDSYTQKWEGEGETRKATVISKRVGEEALTHSFSVADARKAGLWGKQGPWTQYPDRMLLFRARGFNLRDNFGDVLKGLSTTEELQDLPEKIVPGNVIEKMEAPKVRTRKPPEALPPVTTTEPVSPETPSPSKPPQEPHKATPLQAVQNLIQGTAGVTESKLMAYLASQEAVSASVVELDQCPDDVLKNIIVSWHDIVPLLTTTNAEDESQEQPADEYPDDTKKALAFVQAKVRAVNLDEARVVAYMKTLDRSDFRVGKSAKSLEHLTDGARRWLCDNIGDVKSAIVEE